MQVSLFLFYGEGMQQRVECQWQWLWPRPVRFQSSWYCLPLPPHFHQIQKASKSTFAWHILWRCAKSPQSCLTLSSPWSVACQAPLSTGFSRQESWSGLPLPTQGSNPRLQYLLRYRHIRYHWATGRPGWSYMYSNYPNLRKGWNAVKERKLQSELHLGKSLTLLASVSVSRPNTIRPRELFFLISGHFSPSTPHCSPDMTVYIHVSMCWFCWITSSYFIPWRQTEAPYPPQGSPKPNYLLPFLCSNGI